MQNIIEQFRTAMQSAGISPPVSIEADGQLHRFSTNGKKGDTAGWYCLHDARIPAGSFGDWRSEFKQNWKADIGRRLTLKEEEEYQIKIDTIRQNRELEDAKRHTDAQEKASKIWNNARQTSPDHAYLKQKGVNSYGLREYQGNLVVKVTNNGIVHSLQFIRPDGSKQFLTGGRVKECYFVIGDRPKEILCVCEGYATGASIHEATGYTVAVAFNAGNLEPVARTLREKFPTIRLVLCADDDAWTDGNPGLTKAREAAVAVDGLLAIPDFGNDRLQGMTDFNDLAQHKSLESVKNIIENANSPVIIMKDETRNSEASIIGQNGVKLTCAKDVEVESIRWLWEGWLAVGKLHIMAGAPGTGKTTILLSIAAILTVGGHWPDRTRCGNPKNVLIWSGEDDLADTLVPRLLVNGADRKRIHFISGIQDNGKSRHFKPASDMPRLLEEAKKIGNIGLIIIDPIVSAISKDSNNNGDVRQGLQPIVDLGLELGAAVIGITHLTKGTQGRDPLERVTGSLAFGAVARVVLFASKNTTNGGNSGYTLMRGKSNIGPSDGGFHYNIEQFSVPGHETVLASKIVWGEKAEGNASQLMAEETDQGISNQCNTAVTEAKEFLLTSLADGSVPAKELIVEAKKSGISERTLKRAKDSLGVKSIRAGFGPNSFSLWELPHRVPSNNIGCHVQGVASYNNFGILCPNQNGLGDENLSNQINSTVSDKTVRGTI